MKKTKVKNKAASSLGKLGGSSLVRKYGKEYMKKISKKGLKKRWVKKEI